MHLWCGPARPSVYLMHDRRRASEQGLGTVAVMTELVLGFQDQEVEAQLAARYGPTVREAASIPQLEARPMESRPLAVVDGLLRQPVVAAATPADLDDDEGWRRSRIGCDDVKLGTADPHVRGEHVPTEAHEVRGDPRLSVVAGALGQRPHPTKAATTPLPDD